MRNNQIIKKGIFVILSMLFLIASAAIRAEDTQKKEPPISYLFVQSASKAKIEIDKKAANTYKITLKKVSPYVVYFSERPKRIANSMPVEQFLKIWDSKGKNSFKQDSPNADFNGIQVGLLSPDKPLNVVLELSQPVYDSKAKTITYVAKPLQGNVTPIPDSVNLDHVILFIDDACLSCW
jgi:hypothetical protein